MGSAGRYIVGTSGYSYGDWVGAFYPPGTKRQEMFARYTEHFRAVELNFTYYRIPTASMLDKLAAASPEGFAFWVKANAKTTHEQDRSVAGEFIDSLQPMRDRGKLAGVLMQFPQSFHRTAANRQYLYAAIEDFSAAAVPVAVEFRHCSWDVPATAEGLRQQDVTLVVPDVPPLEGLYRPAPTVTSATGYLRLHSRNADKWYAGGQRYDYDYGDGELEAIGDQWAALAEQAGCVFVFFNNCHHAQAARNAQRFAEIVGRR
jgi:uncharacterized protein YecE (DUF72 family)